MNKLTVFILFFTLILSGINCNRNEFDIDVSEIDLQVEINRYDIEMFSIGANDVYYEIPKLQQKYGDFFEIYNIELIGVGLPNQKEYYNNLSEFFYYCDQISLYTEVLKVFPENSEFLKNSVTDAFKHYKYYFPDEEMPKIISCISGFNLSVFTGEDFIGVSLDKYLGNNYKLYSSMFDNYLSRRMHKEMIPVDIMRAHIIARFPFNDSVNTLMTFAIYEGRIQYFLDAMLPNTPDSLKWGYTALQWGWANEYEKNIWDFMVSQKVLFTNEATEIKTYTGEAPFTTPFRNNSAPRAGTFIGYKIVQSYMENNEDVDLQQLMQETDYMKIYNYSYYQP